jgi:hypothetical protein
MRWHGNDCSINLSSDEPQKMGEPSPSMSKPTTAPTWTGNRARTVLQLFSSRAGPTCRSVLPIDDGRELRDEGPFLVR